LELISLLSASAGTDLFKTQIDIIGSSRVAAIVSDSPTVMIAAKRELTATEGYRHIITLRCMMHGFALVLTSSLGHPFAAALVRDAQKIVTFFNSSHRPLALMRQFAEAQGVKTGLKTSNTTRIISVHMCLASVLANRAALEAVIAVTPSVLNLRKAPQMKVKEIILDPDFWYKLQVTCAILEPLSQVISAVQGDATTMGDVTR
jgi:hypothetical protein